MKKILIGLCVLLLIGVGALFLVPNNENSIAGSAVLNNNIDDGVKTFVVTGENFKFVVNSVDNPEIIVNKGDRVRIEFISDKFNISHSITIFDLLSCNIKFINNPIMKSFRAGKFNSYSISFIYNNLWIIHTINNKFKILSRHYKSFNSIINIIIQNSAASNAIFIIRNKKKSANSN